MLLQGHCALRRVEARSEGDGGYRGPACDGATASNFGWCGGGGRYDAFLSQHRSIRAHNTEQQAVPPCSLESKFERDQAVMPPSGHATTALHLPKSRGAAAHVFLRVTYLRHTRPQSHSQPSKDSI